MNRQGFFPASDTQFSILKYNFNMPYTLANMAYLNFLSEENKKECFLLLSFLCVYLGASRSKTLFCKNSLWIYGSLQMGCGGCDKMQMWVFFNANSSRKKPILRQGVWSK